MLVCTDIKGMESLEILEIKDWKEEKKEASYFFHVIRWRGFGLDSSERVRSDEGLTLETLAFQIFLGDISTFTNSFDGTKFSCFYLPTDAAPQFL